MKRSTDEIRYLILKLLSEKRINVEQIRKKINTSLQTMLQNAEDLEIFGFIKMYEIDIGKRKYRELEITEEGKKFFESIKKKFES